ncbi:hypothetical protein F503_01316 [Ophiostoma piceae UAMH 11346]|uniref:Uncharacterized protein n=1 Tax=Ophiostoma piceae (strain UAMH 11346) TaxID=1262450 RepID=S3BUZ6_OPHP1|nr:hypothetical protein F503_01316 [Ophiostoma piceae UAMH 11346]
MSFSSTMRNLKGNQIRQLVQVQEAGKLLEKPGRNRSCPEVHFALFKLVGNKSSISLQAKDMPMDGLAKHIFDCDGSGPSRQEMPGTKGMV